MKLKYYLFIAIIFLFSGCKKEVELFILFDTTVGDKSQTISFYSDYLKKIEPYIMKLPLGCNINFFTTTCYLDNSEPFCPPYQHKLSEKEKSGHSPDSSQYRLEKVWNNEIVPKLLDSWRLCHERFDESNSCIINTISDVGDYSDIINNTNFLLLFSDLIETSTYVNFDSGYVNIDKRLIEMNFKKVRDFEFIGICYKKNNPIYMEFENSGIKIDELWEKWFALSESQKIFSSTNERLVIQNLQTRFTILKRKRYRLKLWIQSFFDK